MKTLLRLSILSVLFFTSCSDNIQLSIDNPTEFSLEITVDTLNVLVPPKTLILLEVAKGEHQLTLNNDSIINYNFTESAYMINPSLSEYLVSEEYYGPEEFIENFKSTIPKKEVTFLGMSLIGNYDVITDVINIETWNYGPRETLPENVEIGQDQLYRCVVKIYDSSEFINVIKRETIE